MSILSTPTSPDDLLWVDDRCVTSYSQQGQGAGLIVGIYEILRILRDASAITEETYYGKLHQLRAGNARFVPVQADEIVYHLRQARVENGRVVPTEALDVLKRYIAACMLPGPAGLQRLSKATPPAARNPVGETTFFIDLRMSTSDTIGKLWTSDDLEGAVARSK